MKSKIPKFKSLEEERKFWDTHSVTDFLDELKPVKMEFVRPKKKLLSVRLDVDQIEGLKKVAARKGLGYLPLIRMWLAEKLSREYRPTHAHHS